MTTSRTPLRALPALRAAVAVAALSFLGSCSLTSVAVRALTSGSGSSGGGAMSVFLGEEDPQIVADSFPTLLKASEALLASDPANADLGVLVGSLYVMYANAFVEGPASMLDDEFFDQKMEAKRRARLFYLRGADYAGRVLERRYPGITTDPAKSAALIKKVGTSLVPAAYWFAAGVCSAFNLDPLDIGLSMKVPLARDLAYRALEVQPDFNSGALYDFFLSFHAGMPDSLGGDRTRIKEFFEKSMASSRGQSPGPYLAWATAVDIPNQDAASFRANLEKALAIDPSAHPESRLLIILTQRKARWYLDHIDDFILGE